MYKYIDAHYITCIVMHTMLHACLMHIRGHVHLCTRYIACTLMHAVHCMCIKHAVQYMYINTHYVYIYDLNRYSVLFCYRDIDDVEINLMFCYVKIR